MIILGFLTDQQDFEAMLERTNQTIENVLNVPGTIDTHAGGSNFRLNNMSFAGPVVMGIGGFLIVAACVMTFEARDSATKIAPTAAAMQKDQSFDSMEDLSGRKKGGGGGRNGHTPVVSFKS